MCIVCIVCVSAFVRMKLRRDLKIQCLLTFRVSPATIFLLNCFGSKFAHFPETRKSHAAERAKRERE